MRRPEDHHPSEIPWVAGPLLVLVAALGAAADSGKRELPPLIEEVQVEVVNVDLVVTDSRGMPVSGLKAEDFSVYEDGSERQITNFFSFTDGRLDVPPTQEGDVEWRNASLQRRMAILFDINSLEKRELERAVEGIERFVMEQFDGSYEWAVVAYKDRLRLMQPFTSDKTTVIGALGRIRSLPLPIRRARATDAAFSEHPVVSSRTQAFGTTPGLDQAGQRRLTAEDFEVRERMFAGLERLDLTARAVIETMRAYSALPGLSPDATDPSTGPK